MKVIIGLIIFGFINQIYANELCPNKMIVGWEKALPFQFKEKDQVKGIDMDTLSIVMKKINCKLEFKEIPWERHLKEIENGTVDIAAGANITPDREVYANFSVPYLTEYVYFYSLKNNISKFKFKNESELLKLNLKIGAINGAYMGPVFEDAVKNKILIPNKNYFLVNNEKQLVELLLAKRIDGIILGEFVNNLHKDIKEHSTKMFEHNTNFMFSKKSVNKNFIEKFNVALEEAKKVGLLSKIRDSYNNDNKAKY